MEKRRESVRDDLWLWGVEVLGLVEEGFDKMRWGRHQCWNCFSILHNQHERKEIRRCMRGGTTFEIFSKWRVAHNNLAPLMTTLLLIMLLHYCLKRT